MELLAIMVGVECKTAVGLIYSRERERQTAMQT